MLAERPGERRGGGALANEGFLGAARSSRRPSDASSVDREPSAALRNHHDRARGHRPPLQPRPLGPAAGRRRLLQAARRQDARRARRQRVRQDDAGAIAARHAEAAAPAPSLHSAQHHPPHRGGLVDRGAPRSRCSSPRWRRSARRLVRAGGWAPALLLLAARAGSRRRTGCARATASRAPRSSGLGRAPAADAPARRRVRLVRSTTRGRSLPAQSERRGAHRPPHAAARTSDGAGRRREVPLRRRRRSASRMHKESGVPWGTPTRSYLEQGLARGELSGAATNRWCRSSPCRRAGPGCSSATRCSAALDVDRQASALQMLQKLQVETGMAILYLSVDLQAVQLMAHAAAFMEKEGRLVEHQDDAHALFDAPRERPTRVYLPPGARDPGARARPRPHRLVPEGRERLHRVGYKTSVRNPRAQVAHSIVTVPPTAFELLP